MLPEGYTATEKEAGLEARLRKPDGLPRVQRAGEQSHPQPCCPHSFQSERAPEQSLAHQSREERGQSAQRHGALSRDSF